MNPVYLILGRDLLVHMHSQFSILELLCTFIVLHFKLVFCTFSRMLLFKFLHAKFECLLNAIEETGPLCRLTVCF